MSASQADQELRMAVESGRVEDCMRALALGARLSTKSTHGEPLLIEAITRCDGAVVDFLLEAGSDPNTRDKAGRTAIHRAYDQYKGYAVEPTLDMVERLALAGGDPGLETAAGGRSPIWNACAGGYHDAVRALLAGGNGLETPSRFGHTPLMVAIWHDRPEAVATLLELGADPKARDREGKTCIAQALDETGPYIKHPTIVAAFERLALEDESRKTAGRPARRI